MRSFQSATNLGGRFTYTPADNIDPANTATPNVAAADDFSDVFTADASVAKTRTTSVSESGNDAATQATIGEDITYTVSATIPEGTTLGSAAALTDTLDSPSRQPYVAGSATATLNGGVAAGSGSRSTPAARPRASSSRPGTRTRPARAPMSSSSASARAWRTSRPTPAAPAT